MKRESLPSAPTSSSTGPGQLYNAFDEKTAINEFTTETPLHIDSAQLTSEDDRTSDAPGRVGDDTPVVKIGPSPTG